MVLVDGRGTLCEACCARHSRIGSLGGGTPQAAAFGGYYSDLVCHDLRGTSHVFYTTATLEFIDVDTGWDYFPEVMK